MRWGLGPVFIYECLANSRRWQTYALRAVGVAALLLAMATIATLSMPEMGNSPSEYADLGQAYFIAMIGVELALVILAAPAATAGAICLDRARGTLSHMLMTDLSDTEIVLGKLAARLLPVVGLVACTWPVMSISSLLGGIDPIALTLAYAIIVAVAVLGCAMALALSVLARKAHEVILATYTVFIVGLLLWPIWYLISMNGRVGPPPTWALMTNPFYVAFVPYADPGKLDLSDYLGFFGVALGTSALLTALAIWRTRPVACRGSVVRSKGMRIGLLGRLTRWLPGPSLDRNPVLWREWHRSRPSRWMTALIVLLMGTTGTLCVVGAIGFWKNGVDFGPGVAYWEVAGVCSYVLHVIFGLLMLAAIAPFSMTEERQRGSLDILAATSLSTPEIVIGKWLGTFRLVLYMTIGPGLIALALATGHSNVGVVLAPSMRPTDYQMISLGARCFGVVVLIATILAHGALITSVGLALAVWIKRQSRAIAFSVGSFILITAAWPIFAFIPLGPGLGGDLATLSPVVACTTFVSFFMSRRYGFAGGILWSASFWAVEMFVLAIGILWLTVGTFDGCVDRVPDRPHRISIWAGVVMIMAALIGSGSMIGAIGWWVEGVKPGGWLHWPESFGVLAYCMLVASGLVMVAVESAKSGRPTWTAFSEETPGMAVRKFVLGRWWVNFRLVVLLAIGPALLAMALATARRGTQYEPQFTTDPSGAQVVTSYVLARLDVPYAGEVRLGQRLMIAAGYIVTILVHGGAAISVGLALATANIWLRRSLVMAVGLTALGVLALHALLAPLASRTSFTVADTLRSVMIWNIAVALFAAGLLMCTIWIWKRRSSGAFHSIDVSLHDS